LPFAGCGIRDDVKEELSFTFFSWTIYDLDSPALSGPWVSPSKSLAADWYEREKIDPDHFRGFKG
jgi:hypothetical protein